MPPVLIVSVVLGGLTTSSFAAGKKAPEAKVPTIDQSLEMHNVSSPKISPDGRRVVYEQSRTDWERNSFETDLWIADVATGETHRLSMPEGSSRDAEWSPDGKWIAFLSSRPGQMKDSPSGKTQLYVMPADGGEAYQATKLENGVEGFDWAPDSQHLAVSAEAPETKAMKDRKESFGEYHVIHADYEMTHLWLVELPKASVDGNVSAPAEPKLLTDKDNGGDSFSVESFRFSPDGKRIAFAATKDPDLISIGSSQVYTLTLADEAVKKLTESDGPNTDPHWSPDGSEIAFNTANGDKYFFYADQRIAVIPANGGKSRVVTGDFDEDPSVVEWGPEGIYFGAEQKTKTAFFVADPKTGSVKALETPGSENAGAASFSKDFKHIAYRGAGANAYGEIYAADLPVSQPRQLTHAGEQTARFETAKREVVRWKSGDGAEIEGVLYKPANFDAKKKYPLLVVIHGGPTGVDTPVISPDRYYPIEKFVARGAVVLRPNYRGSAGYGAKFRALNVRNLGVGDYADVISGVDYLIGQGYVDKDRVGSMGWSEGGYISAFITASSDRFKAVSVGAGISDWMTYYVNTDITPFTPQYLHATPWSDPEIYAKTSPITYIAKAKTPTLIQHGGADRRVPIPNAFELRQALEDHGVPVKMVVYDGFGHPINKPKQQRAVMEENWNWFAHYIWGDPLPEALTPVVKAKDDKTKDEKKDAGKE
ncbi:MAG TPA: S9 family peptidase [Acidobacteriaceae bacterium]